MHTRTPWKVAGKGVPHAGGCGPHDWLIVGDIQEDDDGSESRVVIAHVKGNETSGTIAEDNANRAVECVNACISVPHLPPGIVAELVELVKQFGQATKIDQKTVTLGEMRESARQCNKLRPAIRAVLAKLAPESTS